MLFVVLQAVAPAPGGDGSRQGRRGNALYRQEDYAGAAAAYRDGLAASEGRGPGFVRSGLFNNLGAALYRSEDYEAAAEAFRNAMGAAVADADFARAAYNAGNAAMRREDLQAAVDRYRQALLANPDDEDAKFNYEFARRRLDEQQRSRQQQNRPQEQQPDQETPQDTGRQPPPQEQPDQEGQPEPGPQQQGQDQPQPRPPAPDALSREEAERILQALQNDEAQLLRQVQQMKTPPRRVEKDW